MRRGSRLSAIALTSVVSIVLPVSGFAQTDDRDRADTSRVSDAVVRLYVPEPEEAAGAVLPANIAVSSMYRAIVDRMLEQSPTFRRQCARIGTATALSVQIEPDPSTAVERPQATTTIARFEYGRMRAVVRLRASTRSAELIAHEIEHILEQLDGVDLPARARLQAGDVRVASIGRLAVYETTRAVAVGQRVMRELDRD
jgi:hypothetical protein